MKILHIIGNTEIGGIAVVVRNYMKHIDRDKYHFDFATSEMKIGEIGIQLKQMGANLYYLPLKSVNFAEHKLCLKKILIEGQYDAVHVHSNSTSYVDLSIAKRLGIKCRVAHAHSMGFCFGLQDYLQKYSGRVLNYYFATTIIGCGKKAGNEIFGRKHMRSSKAIVLPNAIETEKYKYDSNIRSEIRKELGLGSSYVIGMVGRVSPEKNHIFAIDIIQKLKESDIDVKMLVIGDGQDLSTLRETVYNKKIEKAVLFLGSKQDVERYYNAMDICIMPSLYEGFPMVGVEAACSGLPLVLSERITTEFLDFENVQYLPLRIDLWVDALKKKPVVANRSRGMQIIKQNGFDIDDSARQLERIYESSR